MASASPSASDAARDEKRLLTRRVSQGGLWFLLLAGNAMASAIGLWKGSPFPFDLDLGFTRFVVKFAESFGWPVRGTLLSADVGVALVFLFLWHQALNRRREAFLAGMIVYGVDAAMLIIVQEHFLAMVHGVGLVMLYLGWKAVKRLESTAAAG